MLQPVHFKRPATFFLKFNTENMSYIYGPPVRSPTQRPDPADGYKSFPSSDNSQSHRTQMLRHGTNLPSVIYGAVNSQNSSPSPFVNCSLPRVHLQEHGFPSRCSPIPQLTYCEPSSSFFTQAETQFRWPCIVFRQEGSSGLGMRVADVALAVTKGKIRKLGLMDANDHAFKRPADGQIKIRISWPGYRLDPFEQRWSTHEGTISRAAILAAIVECVCDFFDRIRRNKIPVERGQEPWAIGMRPDGSRGLEASDVVVTALHHCGRFNWQPELWIPDYLIN